MAKSCKVIKLRLRPPPKKSEIAYKRCKHFLLNNFFDQRSRSMKKDCNGEQNGMKGEYNGLLSLLPVNPLNGNLLQCQLLVSFILDFSFFYQPYMVLENWLEHIFNFWIQEKINICSFWMSVCILFDLSAILS